MLVEARLSLQLYLRAPMILFLLKKKKDNRLLCTVHVDFPVKFEILNRTESGERSHHALSSQVSGCSEFTGLAFTLRLCRHVLVNKDPIDN